tara:strand:+ start:56 stop:430 length:375 start_codon:yes stop_codon:yes gene_type:complete
MNQDRDLNKIAKIEKAIREKYGEEAIQNPKKSWTPEKEEKYLENLKAFNDKREKKKKIKDQSGFRLKEIENKNHIERTCPVCGSYSFSAKDDLYMTKFECCFKCFIQFVEGRLERWKSGWRPNS